jgi:hypothetical protein
MLLDLGDNPPRVGPGSGLIAEIGMEPVQDSIDVGHGFKTSQSAMRHRGIQDVIRRNP